MNLLIIHYFLILVSIFIGNTQQQSTQIIKLDPVYLTENHNDMQLSNASKLLIQFQTIQKQIKRLQLIPNSFKSSNNVQQRLFYIDSTDLTLNANLSSHLLDREYLINEKQCTNGQYEDDSTFSNSSDCIIRLKVAAYDSLNSIVSMFIVPIVIVDLNDQKPQFRHSLYRLNISENLQSTSLPLDAPLDSDSAQNSIKGCEFETANNLFELNFNIDTHRLLLNVKQPLDREMKSEYDLVILCTDGLTIARASLIIDVLDANDNAPFFKQNLFVKNISENSNNTFLIDLKAIDLDDPKSPNAQLVYSLPFELNSNEIISLFEINELNGTLTVKSNTQLDYEKKTKYSLKVKVQDKGSNPVPVYTDVHLHILDVNDNPPQGHLSFVDKYLIKQDKTNNTIWIYEELDIDTALAYLTLTDADTSLINGNKLSADLISNTFKLVPIIQEYDNLYYALQLINRIDREKQSFYDLTIKLSDNGTSKQFYFLNLRIILLDINDNKPMFKNTDQNQGIMYTFDLRENKIYSDLTKIKAVDLDLELNMLKYEIMLLTAGSLMPPFEIDSKNGNLIQLKQLDREKSSKYAFKVKCSDESHLASEILVQINVIDENDNLPLFSNWQSKGVTFDLDEEQPAQVIVGNVKAYDADLNSSLYYFLKPDSINNYFLINNSTGNIITKTKFDSDSIQSIQPSVLVNNTKFIFEIIAVDLDRSLGVQIEQPLNEQKLKLTINLIDLNDNKPLVQSTENVTILNSSSNCSNQTRILIQTIETVDLDRDFNKIPAQNKHLFRLNYIKRLSWSVLYELSIASNTNRTYDSLIEILNDLKQQKVIQNINLRQLFSIKALNNLSDESNVNKAELVLKKTCDINSGVYIFGTQIIDRSSDAMQRLTYNNDKRKKQYWKTEFVSKLFLLNSTRLSQNELNQLNAIIDSWWLRQNNDQSDDNGDDLDSQFSLSKQSNTFSLARGILFTNSSSLVSNLRKYLVANSSNSIIILISLFLLISILLISLISFKHYKASNRLIVHDTIRDFNSTTITDETNSTSSPSQHCLRKSQPIGTNSTATASTNLSINSLNNLKRSHNEEVDLLDVAKNTFSSPSSSFFESYNQPAQQSISEHQIQCYIQANNEDEEDKSNSNGSDSSFTVITTSITPDSTTTTTILTSQGPAASISIPGNTHTNYRQLNQQQSSPSFLSTFQIQPLVKHEQLAIIEHDDEDEDESLVKVQSISNDIGYYGSSDYSDNSSSLVQCKKQVYRQQQHRPAKYVTNKLASSISSAIISGTTSSMSSEAAFLTSSSTSSPLFTSLRNQPIVTNLYPPYSFNSNKIEEDHTNSSISNDSVKVYLERFERIYNSSSTQESQRNSYTDASYSYV